MDECCQVADRIREAGRCDRQEIGKLGSSKRISNDAPAYPISRSDGTPPSRSHAALPKQDPDSISFEASIPPRGERNRGIRTRSIELRHPRSLQRNKQNTRREEEKFEATRRVAMAEQTIPIFNGYFCRKLRRKERRSTIVA
jgi:hypothetical protein